jgi:hypothetical protein
VCLFGSHSAAAESFKFDSVHLALNGCHLRGAHSGSATAQAAGSLPMRRIRASDDRLPMYAGIEHNHYRPHYTRHRGCQKQQDASATSKGNFWPWTPARSSTFAIACCARSLLLFIAHLRGYSLVLDHGHVFLLLHSPPRMRPSKARSSHVLVPLNSKHHLAFTELSGQEFASACSAVSAGY